jgi:hypothetical protein
MPGFRREFSAQIDGSPVTICPSTDFPRTRASGPRLARVDRAGLMLARGPSFRRLRTRMDAERSKVIVSKGAFAHSSSARSARRRVEIQSMRKCASTRSSSRRSSWVLTPRVSGADAPNPVDEASEARGPSLLRERKQLLARVHPIAACWSAACRIAEQRCRSRDVLLVAPQPAPRRLERCTASSSISGALITARARLSRDEVNRRRQ